MQLPILKSITDFRRDTKRIFDEVRKKNEVVLVVKNNDKLSVVVSPDYYQSIIDENNHWAEFRRQLFVSSRLDSINIETSGSYVRPLVDFFKLREKRW